MSFGPSRQERERLEDYSDGTRSPLGDLLSWLKETQANTQQYQPHNVLLDQFPIFGRKRRDPASDLSTLLGGSLMGTIAAGPIGLASGPIAYLGREAARTIVPGQYKHESNPLYEDPEQITDEDRAWERGINRSTPRDANFIQRSMSDAAKRAGFKRGGVSNIF